MMNRGAAVHLFCRRSTPPELSGFLSSGPEAGPTLLAMCWSKNLPRLRGGSLCLGPSLQPHCLPPEKCHSENEMMGLLQGKEDRYSSSRLPLPPSTIWNQRKTQKGGSPGSPEWCYSHLGCRKGLGAVPHRTDSTGTGPQGPPSRTQCQPEQRRAPAGQASQPFGSDSGAGPSQSFPCSQEKWEQNSSTFPGRSLELLNGLQKVLARRVFSDYQPAGWEWISAGTATSLLGATPLASTHTPEVQFGSLSQQRHKERSVLTPCPPVCLRPNPACTWQLERPQCECQAGLTGVLPHPRAAASSLSLPPRLPVPLQGSLPGEARP